MSIICTPEIEEQIRCAWAALNQAMPPSRIDGPEAPIASTDKASLRKISLTFEEKRRILALRKRGKTIEDIAGAVGVSEHVVTKTLKEAP